MTRTLDKLASFPLAPSLPLRANPSDIGTPRFKRLSKYFDQEYWQALSSRCRARGIRPTVVFCTAYAEVLAFWSNQTHFALNLTVSNRDLDRHELRDIVGDFTSVMLIEVDLEPDAGFWEHARGVQEALTTAMAHRAYEGVELIRELARYNDLGERAAMPVVLTSLMSGDYQEGWSQLGEIKYGITQTPQCYLDNQAARSADGLCMRWDYVEQLFDETTIERMFEQYIGLLESAAGLRDGYRLEIDSADRALISSYNSTEQEIPAATLHELFVRQAARTPQSIAVALGDSSMSYRELDERSNRIAAYLQAQGLRRGERVGILAHREIGSIVNIMGVLKAGLVYVPVSPEHPLERRSYMFENSGCSIVLEPDAWTEEWLQRYDSAPPAALSHPDDIAYVIYTSGSTGAPKGVVITHKAATNTILDINQRFDVGPDDRIIGISSLCFDLSVYDIFGALSTGATLVMVPDQRDPHNLARVVREAGITIWNTVPAILDMTAEIVGGGLDNDSLRLVLLSGDWIPLQLPDRIREHCRREVEVIGLGGATEGSIWSIYHVIDEIREGWRSIPYGKPLANQCFYVLAYNDRLCPVGVQGELCIGGAGVALGYDNAPEITARSFFHHPELGYLYRTGDHGILHRDGNIEFIGRKDRQVKIGGYRIELDEIRSCLLAHPSIKKAVVTSPQVNGCNGKRSLCSYVVSDIAIEGDELRAHLRQRLPEYMVPAHILQVDDIPLTANGKIEVRNLPEPRGTSSVQKTVVAPRNETERRIAEEWRQVLDLDPAVVGVRDSFFELGGDSLMAIQLVSRLAAHFDIGVNQVFEHHTIEELAAHVTPRPESLKKKIRTLQQRMASYNSAAAMRDLGDPYRAYLRQIERDSELDLASRSAYRAVLLTGATGYLGSYLVRDLLEQTGAELFLPVRAGSAEAAESRLEQSLAWYFGPDLLNRHRDRVHVLAADLSEPRLGLGEAEYRSLAGEVDCIINAAADVRHFGLYDELHRINVGGTERLIRLCGEGRSKDLHHISTTGLGIFDARSNDAMLFSELSCDLGREYHGYYLATKAAAERCVTESRRHGLDARIYRVGVLVFDADTGVFQRNIEDNAFYGNLRSYIRLGTLPETALGELDFSFVDRASRAITLLHDQSCLRSHTFHVYNPHPTDLPELAAMLRDQGIPMKTRPFWGFLDALQRDLKEHGWHEHGADLLFSYSIYEGIPNLPRVTAERTCSLLRRLGFAWPRLDATHVSKMVRHCREVGFL